MGRKKLPRNLVFNAVNSCTSSRTARFFDTLGPQAAKIKEYHRLFPEIYKGQMSVLEPVCDNCMTQMFEGPLPVVTVGNPTGKEVEASLALPVTSDLDRVTSGRVPLVNGKASLKLAPWEVRAYEVRP